MHYEPQEPGRMQEQASRVGTQAKEQAEAGRERAAEGAERAAERVREAAGGRGGMQEQVGTKVADGMERTASYLRERDTDAMMADLERYVREHPAQAVAGAVGIGFVIGRILR